MTQSIGQSEYASGAPDVPALTPEVVKRFRQTPHEFDQLDAQLRTRDRALADFVLARAGQLAPGAEHLHEKQRIAQVALEVYGLLVQQAEVNALEQTLAAS